MSGILRCTKTCTRTPSLSLSLSLSLSHTHTHTHTVQFQSSSQTPVSLTMEQRAFLRLVQDLIRSQPAVPSDLIIDQACPNPQQNSNCLEPFGIQRMLFLKPISSSWFALIIKQALQGGGKWQTLATVCVNIHECTLEHRAKHCEITLANHYSDIEWITNGTSPCGGPFLFLSLVPCVWVKKVAKLCKVVARIENKLESRQACNKLESICINTIINKNKDLSCPQRMEGSSWAL